jgi:N-methylhydantoinase A
MPDDSASVGDGNVDPPADVEAEAADGSKADRDAEAADGASVDGDAEVASAERTNDAGEAERTDDAGEAERTNDATGKTERTDDAGETRVGVDVGGTFTDVVAVRGGRVSVHKTPSTPQAPERGVVDGLRRVEGRDGLDPTAIDFLGHGTTVATNAVLEREWADTALVTTEGFRDVLEIGRQDRPDLYDFRAEKPTPVVERDRRYEVPGRIDGRGDVLDPLDEAAVRDLADELRGVGVESVAISFLFPFEDDAHERRVREILREEGVDAAISLSSVVLPEIREYERTLATALNAALKPVMAGYVGRLGERLRESGVGAPLKIMQSNGGIITAGAARERPVDTLLSGPAAGVQGAVHVAGRRGEDDLLTMDMGGTSCDVSLVEGGDPPVATDVEVGGYPVSVPTVDVHTVGAGGGSVAWLDTGGALRVGPKSAGADPGPVCYGRGGDRPTVTDAQLLLGRIDPASFLGGDPDGSTPAAEGADAVGSIEPDAAVEDARRVFERDLADPLGIGVREAAAGVLDVANANMERALRVVSVERGYDPREFALVAYGGAGPLHAPALAEALGAPRVIVPRTAGVLSALGLLVSDVVYDHSASRVRPWAEVDPESLAATFEEFAAAGRERLDAEGIPPSRRRFEPSVDLRYAGQAFELSVPVSDLDDSPAVDLDDDAMAAVAGRFHERHRRRYGHASPDEPIELVTIRLRTRGAIEAPDLAPADAGDSLADARSERREVVFDGERRRTDVYDRGRLPPGGEFDGPAVIEGVESTTVVHPGQRARVDDDANLVVDVAGRGGSEAGGPKRDARGAGR